MTLLAPVLDAPAARRSGPVDGEGRVRPFTRDDIAAVVALRQLAFQHTTRPAPAEQAAFVARAFLDNPWRDPELPSLVHLDDAGEVNGFIGVVPRKMRFEGRPIRVAVPTQLMMRPGAPAGSGLRLARTVFEGPQDLTISDSANDAAHRIWMRIGGTVSVAHSLHWTLPLQRGRYALSRLSTTPTRRAGAFLLRPACRLFDHLERQRTGRGVPAFTSERFDPVAEVALLNEIAATWRLHPDYDATGIAWALAEVARKPDHGPLEARLVKDAGGRSVGWFLYFVNRGGVGEVVALAARPGDQGKLFGHLIAHARAAGVVALAGRVEPLAVDAVAAYCGRFHREGPWFLTHARDPRLLAALLNGSGFVSRLEGEWWLNF